MKDDDRTHHLPASRGSDFDALIQEEVYEQHKQTVLAYVTELTGDRSTAEDVLQETLSSEYRALSNVRMRALLWPALPALREVEGFHGGAGPKKGMKIDVNLEFPTISDKNLDALLSDADQALRRYLEGSPRSISTIVDRLLPALERNMPARCISEAYLLGKFLYDAGDVYLNSLLYQADEALRCDFPERGMLMRIVDSEISVRTNSDSAATSDVPVSNEATQGKDPCVTDDIADEAGLSYIVEENMEPDLLSPRGVGRSPQQEPPARTEEANFDDFADFFRKEYPKVVRFVMYTGATFEEADDAVSHAMTRAYACWPLLTQPDAWIRTVAQRFYFGKINKNRRRSDIETEGRLDCVEHGSVELPEEPAERRRVIAVLRSLPPWQRQVMAWILDGYAPSEIAAELKVTAESVRASLQKARRTLAEQTRSETNDE